MGATIRPVDIKVAEQIIGKINLQTLEEKDKQDFLKAVNVYAESHDGPRPIDQGIALTGIVAGMYRMLHKYVLTDEQKRQYVINITNKMKEGYSIDVILQMVDDYRFVPTPKFKKGDRVRAITTGLKSANKILLYRESNKGKITDVTKCQFNGTLTYTYDIKWSTRRNSFPFKVRDPCDGVPEADLDFQ